MANSMESRHAVNERDPVSNTNLKSRFKSDRNMEADLSWGVGKGRASKGKTVLKRVQTPPDRQTSMAISRTSVFHACQSPPDNVGESHGGHAVTTELASPFV